MEVDTIGTVRSMFVADEYWKVHKIGRNDKCMNETYRDWELAEQNFEYYLDLYIKANRRSV